MEEKKDGGLCKAAFVLGIISIVFALLPLLSAWFMFLTAINYILTPVGLICGIIALVKSQNTTKSVIGIVLCVLAFFAPILLAEYYLASAVETTVNVLDSVGDITNNLN